MTIGPGTVINESYRVVRRVAIGGMATVYEAILLGTGQRVALKIPHEQFRQDKDGLRRFLREAQAAMAIRADNVVQIVAVGRLPNRMPFLAMEYIDGVGLRDVMYPPDDTRLPTRTALSLVDQIAAAIESAHAAGVIHRDLKPDNVLITAGPDGMIAKVFDFGLSFIAMEGSVSRLTTTGTTFGTPQYMAPEQIRGAKHVDARVDVYALGVILYEMLAARWPFEGVDAHDVWHKATYDPPVPLATHRPDLPAGLLEIVMRAISREASDRYATATELREAIAPFWKERSGTSTFDAALPPCPSRNLAAGAEGVTPCASDEAVTVPPRTSPFDRTAIAAPPVEAKVETLSRPPVPAAEPSLVAAPRSSEMVSKEALRHGSAATWWIAAAAALVLIALAVIVIARV